MRRWEGILVMGMMEMCFSKDRWKKWGKTENNKFYRKEIWRRWRSDKKGPMLTCMENITISFLTLTLWCIVSREHTMEVSKIPLSLFSLLSPISLCFYYPNSHLSDLACSPSAVLKHPWLFCQSLPALLRLFPSLCFLLKYMWRISDSFSVQTLFPVRQCGFI